jgi:hypothetical protein
VGNFNHAQHYDGTSWSELVIDAEMYRYDVMEVTGASADNVLMAGEETWFFNGTEWTGFTHDPRGRIERLWCRAANDYYGVKDDRVMRFDGAGWSEVFRLPGYTNDWELTGVWVDGAGAVYAVGVYGDVWRYSDGELAMFNRSAISITGIWGASDDDVYAVADHGAWLHFDGEEWSYQEPFSTGHLRSIWGTSADDIYAVDRNWVFQFDGSEWRRLEDAPEVEPRDVWRSPEGDLFVAGDKGVAVRKRGGWQATKAYLKLRCVWGWNSSNVFAAGDRTLLHYDGEQWSLADHEMDRIYDLWGSKSGAIYATTSDGLFRNTGKSWQRVEGAPRGDLNDVWGSYDNDLYVTGSGGRLVYHFDGRRRTLIHASEDEGVFAIWGTSPTNIFTGGSYGMLMRYAPEGAVQ